MSKKKKSKDGPNIWDDDEEQEELPERFVFSIDPSANPAGTTTTTSKPKRRSMLLIRSSMIETSSSKKESKAETTQPQDTDAPHTRRRKTVSSYLTLLRRSKHKEDPDAEGALEDKFAALMASTGHLVEEDITAFERESESEEVSQQQQQSLAAPDIKEGRRGSFIGKLAGKTKKLARSRSKENIINSYSNNNHNYNTNGSAVSSTSGSLQTRHNRQPPPPVSKDKQQQQQLHTAFFIEESTTDLWKDDEAHLVPPS